MSEFESNDKDKKSKRKPVTAIAGIALALTGLGVGINRMTASNGDSHNDARPNVPAATASSTPGASQEAAAPSVTPDTARPSPTDTPTTTATTPSHTASKSPETKPVGPTFETAKSSDIAKVSVDVDKRGMTVTPRLTAPDGQDLSTVNLPFETVPTGLATTVDDYGKPANPNAKLILSDAKLTAYDSVNPDSNDPVLLVMETSESGVSTPITYTNSQGIDVTRRAKGVVTLATDWTKGEVTRDVVIGSQYELQSDKLNADKTVATRTVKSTVATFKLYFDTTGNIVKVTKQA